MESIDEQVDIAQIEPSNSAVWASNLPASPIQVDEVADYICKRCNMALPDIISFNAHLANPVYHNWCFVCSRDFHSPTAFAQVRLASRSVPSYFTHTSSYS